MLQTPVLDFPPLMGLFPFYVFTFMALAFYGYFGLHFMHQGRSVEDNRAQRSYYFFFGLFTCTVMVIAGFRVWDHVFAALVGFPIFSTNAIWTAHLRAAFANPSLAFVTLWESDFWTFAVCLNLFCISFLIRPFEKYAAGKSRAPISVMCLVLTPVQPIVRVLQVNSYGWFGCELVAGAPLTWALIIIELIVAFFTLFALFWVLSLYIRMVRSAPSKTILRRKSKFVVFGLLAWFLSLFTIDYFQWGLEALFADVYSLHPLAFCVPFLLGTFLFIALILLVSGMRREYSA